MRLLGLLLTLLAPTVLTPAAGAGADPVGVWPLHPRPPVARGFDPPGSPWGSGHRGVDLRGHVGEVARSALPGRVAWAGLVAGRGVVVVDHGATRTTYEPVAATVHVGDRVGAGGAIGTLELTGSHCLPGACLHWGWLRGSTYLDPLRLVGAGPVRLLPLWGDQPGAAAGLPALPYAGVLRHLATAPGITAPGITAPGITAPGITAPGITAVIPLTACSGARAMGPVGQARGCACW